MAPSKKQPTGQELISNGVVAQMEPSSEEVWSDECDARADEEGQGGLQAWQDQYLPQERRSPP